MDLNTGHLLLLSASTLAAVVFISAMGLFSSNKLPVAGKVRSQLPPPSPNTLRVRKNKNKNKKKG